jgi:hypothetical protein
MPEGMPQVIECLPSKHKVLCLILSTSPPKKIINKIESKKYLSNLQEDRKRTRRRTRRKNSRKNLLFAKSRQIICKI